MMTAKITIGHASIVNSVPLLRGDILAGFTEQMLGLDLPLPLLCEHQ